MTMTIRLDSIKKVKEFVNITNNYSGEIEVLSGRNTVDARSIMGILSLDLKNNLILDIKTEENLPVLLCVLKPYRVA